MLRNAPIGFRKSKQDRVRRRRWVVYAAVVVALLMLLRTPLTQPLSVFFAAIARPFVLAELSVSAWLHETGALLASKESLLRENVRLQEALDLAALEAYSREQLRVENERLKAAFGRLGERDLILAKVMATPGRSPYDTLVLDVGDDYGLLPGMQVFTDGDFAIGEVERVMAKSAVVSLHSSNGRELPVTVGSTSIPAVLVGEGGGNFRITLPRGAPVFPGDIVAIPALAPTYTGVVEGRVEESGGSLQDLFVRWPFNVYELSWVYVDVAGEAHDR